jgi:hypothetical protein
VEKREETNEVRVMVAFGRVAIGWRLTRLFTRFVRHHSTWTRSEEYEWYIGEGMFLWYTEATTFKSTDNAKRAKKNARKRIRIGRNERCVNTSFTVNL